MQADYSKGLFVTNFLLGCLWKAVIEALWTCSKDLRGLSILHGHTLPANFRDDLWPVHPASVHCFHSVTIASEESLEVRKKNVFLILDCMKILLLPQTILRRVTVQIKLTACAAVTASSSKAFGGKKVRLYGVINLHSVNSAHFVFFASERKWCPPGAHLVLLSLLTI